MCSGSKRKVALAGLEMEYGSQKLDGSFNNFSPLLELSASDDLIGFKRAVEEEGRDVNETGFWYGRRIGSKSMGFEERTPLMIAALFGSKDVLSYVIGTGCVDVNKACGSDGVTALHCAAAGGSVSAAEVVKVLLDASADVNSLDVSGNRPGDLIASVVNSGFDPRKRNLEIMLKGSSTSSEEEAFDLSDQIFHGIEGLEQQEITVPRVSKEWSEKKEYPIDPTLPDIKNGIYGTDDFRMYTFKIMPCSRAYSHDWTECPFVHPGENARRRDPRKYHYSCVPCPEFRKGTCRQGDACEYAHGIFECWLHPAQYRTRLCKDEINCSRRVCFFAHKPEELRPLYASTGSAVASISLLALGSPSVMIPPTSTLPMTPSGASSPIGGNMWQNQSNITPPTLQLPGSRLKSALCARDMDLDLEIHGRERSRRWQQQLIDEASGLSSPSNWNNAVSKASFFVASSGDHGGELKRLGVKPTNLEDFYGSLDPAILPELQGLSLDVAASYLQSPTAVQMCQSMNHQLRSSYPTSLSSSPGRAPTSLGIDPSGAAAAVFSSRSAAFAKRSQSFIDRSAVNRHNGFSSPAASANGMPSNLSDWGSPVGKFDWGFGGEEFNKLRKSASFGFRSASPGAQAATSIPETFDEPDVSWVQTLVKDAPSSRAGHLAFEDQQQQCHVDDSGSEMLPVWVEQLYMEQEQMVA
ncbi:Zinc finger family protein [Tripterygium wilfordii]|uniref:Zinc finger family protein n=1 Tax=Tripterygium wilfordii TaxID=458696 RepID=A0A7J7BZQ4_TRIWF|nr:zinc finger CCCH domain-containing protein 66-like [Tripterygium wilfordii]KAF5727328.1 Zinc finger family protein [Tripterygium wilfordii]